MHLRPGVTTYAIAWLLQTRSMAPSLIYTVSFSLRKIIHLVHLHSGTVWRTHYPLCRLKVKVTLQCHGIYPSILCLSDPYFYSPLLAEPFELVLNKLHPNVLSVWQCAESTTQIPRFKIKVTLQGHVVIYPWISCLLHISPEPFEWFTLNFTQILVRQCA